ncbi:hypothetical protein HY989_00565 [Candidatus Micrarchaeota archaeon]|nr:hypothetical protein [Candidatus Micrarchaeota archaeon]
MANNMEKPKKSRKAKLLRTLALTGALTLIPLPLKIITPEQIKLVKEKEKINYLTPESFYSKPKKQPNQDSINSREIQKAIGKNFMKDMRRIHSQDSMGNPLKVDTNSALFREREAINRQKKIKKNSTISE